MPGKISKLFFQKTSSTCLDVGLLVLRIGVMVPLFLRHGVEKMIYFPQMAQQFPDPVHIGMLPSLVIAFISDAICAVLVLLGVATRWSAVYIAGNIFVAWAVYRNFWFWHATHGELQVVYMAVMVALILVGPGKYSLDYLIENRKAR